MGMHRLYRALIEPVAYWPAPIDDGHGEQTWPAPTQCRGRCLVGYKMMPQADGVQAADRVAIDCAPIGGLPVVGGYVWCGDLGDLPDIATPPLEGDSEEIDVIAREIVSVHQVYGYGARLETLIMLMVR